VCLCFRVWCFTWFLAIVVSFKVRLLGFCANAFLMLSGCITLISISLFTIVFYTKNNVRFRFKGKAKWKFWGKFNLKIFGWIWLWEELEWFYSCYVDLIHVTHAHWTSSLVLTSSGSTIFYWINATMEPILSLRSNLIFNFVMSI